ncbi:hypothetical protein BKA70DRAFT_1279064 [Coprinopsis sp. MPI-PUGE-AT-0042]|nr:hypothetical protein BKA70DRAFT_1279064 [Coprinopsis sp. MPI-PUGE-AT-0042]
MTFTVEVDPRILPYTNNNDPLPSKLRPVLDRHLEAARIQVAIRDNKIQRLEKEIEDLQLELQRQREERDGHNSAIRALASTASVVRRLPPEIIASILAFSAVAGRRGIGERYILNACAVSKLWRCTALSTPTLWRALHIHLDRFANGKSHDQAKLLLGSTLDLWFSRSGEGAGVELSFSRGDRFCDGLPACDIVDWVLHSRFQFAMLSFMDVLLTLSDLQSLLSTNAPSLHQTEVLSVGVAPARSTASQVTPTIDVSSTLPNLEVLSIVGHLKFGLLQALIVHRSLTELHLAQVRLRTGELLRVMGGCHSLQSLVLHRSSQLLNEETGAQASSPLTHISMRKIRVYNNILDFFSGLTCPALEKLELDSDFWLDNNTTMQEYLNENDAQAVGSFLQRSQPSNLILYLGAQFPTTFLNTIFSVSCPAIKVLHLCSPLCLPLGILNDGTRLVLPSSVSSIRCPARMSEEDVASWNKELALCLDDPPNQALSIVFGLCEVD